MQIIQRFEIFKIYRFQISKKGQNIPRLYVKVYEN